MNTEFGNEEHLAWVKKKKSPHGVRGSYGKGTIVGTLSSLRTAKPDAQTAVPAPRRARGCIPA